jgi:hypothetical protein
MFSFYDKEAKPNSGKRHCSLSMVIGENQAEKFSQIRRLLKNLIYFDK